MPYKDPVKAKDYAKAYRLRNAKKNQTYQKEYQLTNKEYLVAYKHERYKLKRFDKYGISKEAFLSNLEKQNEQCAICKSSFSEKNRVYIDHCHTTGRVRGLVCFHCNTGMGHFKDNPLLLKKAIDYLNDNPFHYS